MVDSTGKSGACSPSLSMKMDCWLGARAVRWAILPGFDVPDGTPVRHLLFCAALLANIARFSRPRSREGVVACCAFAALTALVIGWPVIALIWKAVSSGPGAQLSGMDPLLDRSRVMLLVTSLAWAGGIATLAVGVAWPSAWLVRNHPRLFLWVIAPLALPSYFAYGALNLLRAPGSWLGDAAEQAAVNGHVWVPVLLGRAIAVCSLTLWVYPASVIVLAPFIASIDEDVLDATRLDAGEGISGSVMRVRLAARGLLAAFLLTMLLLLGSPVAMHAAQIPTTSMRVWMTLTANPGDNRVWLEATPMLLFAVGCTIWFVRSLFSRLSNPHRGRATGWSDEAMAGGSLGVARMPRVGLRTSVAALAAWGLAVVVPLWLLADASGGVSSILGFVHLVRDEILTSAGVAAVVGASCAMLGLIVWYGASEVRGWAAKACLMVLAGAWIAASLSPGILIGRAVWVAWNGLALPQALVQFIQESAPVVVATHVARYGGLAVCLGLALAAAEPAALRELRLMEGGNRLRGFIGGCVAARGWSMLGVTMAIGFLSLHDIDATVMVQPPGAPGLAAMLLGYLHFFRTQELGSACTLLLGGWLLTLGIVAGGRWVLGSKAAT